MFPSASAPRAGSGQGGHSSASTWSCVAILIGAFLAVCGSKWELLATWGSEHPLLDEWEGTVNQVLLPWLRGELAVSNLWHPTNEHHIIWTRLTTLGLTWLNEQWDQRLVAAFNVLLFAIGFLMPLWMLARHVSAFSFAACAVFFAWFLGLDFNWGNVLYGFQSPFYFLVLSTFGCFWLCVFQEPFSPRWFLGIAIGVMGLGSMASWFLCFPITALLLVVRSIIHRRFSARLALALLLLGLLVVAGFLTVGAGGWGDSMRARTFGEFTYALVSVLAWPLHGLPWGSGVVLQLPMIVLIARWMRRGAPADIDAMLCALMLWVLLQGVSIATGRGHELVATVSRYQDIYGIGILANACAIARLVHFLPRAVVVAGASAWIVLLVPAMHRVSQDTFHLRCQSWKTGRELHHLRAYAQTANRENLLNAPSGDFFTHPQSLLSIVDKPELRGWLPASFSASPLLLPLDRSTGFSLHRSPHPAQTLLPPVLWVSRDGGVSFVSQPFGPDRLPTIRLEVLRLEGSGAAFVSIVSTDGLSRSEAMASLLPGQRACVWLPWPATDQPCRLEVNSPQNVGRLAFTPPVFAGKWSLFSERLLVSAVWIRFAGLACMAAGILGLLRWSQGSSGTA